MEWTRLVLTSLTFALLAFDSAWTFKYNSIAKYYSAHRRRCKEKSLEARETSADAVFTGTIQNLISDRRNPDTKVEFSYYLFMYLQMYILRRPPQNTVKQNSPFLLPPPCVYFLLHLLLY